MKHEAHNQENEKRSNIWKISKNKPVEERGGEEKVALELDANGVEDEIVTVDEPRIVL